MKRGFLGLVLIFVIFLSLISFIKPASSVDSDSVSCCCNVLGWTIQSLEGPVLRRGTCISNLEWVPKAGADKACEEECRALCGGDCPEESATLFVSSVIGAGCSGIDDSIPNGYSKCIPVCGNGVRSEGEECEEKSDCGTDSNVYCAGCKCRRTEICNGIDDDKDGMVDEDDSIPCESSYCLADAGDCPLDSVCSSSSTIITGAVGEGDKQCKICKSICKVCPPHPPNATKNNPLGICASEEKGGYPFSKNCLDWKNKVSCGTCVDENKNPEDRREKFKPKENDGNYGVDMNGKPIFRDGDKVECDANGCTFPKIEKPENNKDYKTGDEVIDCRLALPTIFSGVDESDPISNANAFNGICTKISESESICGPRPFSSCMTDCYWGYEVGWKKEGTKLTTEDLEKGDGDDIKLTYICPNNKQNYEKYIDNAAMKRTGSWGELLSKSGPDCEIKGASYLYTKCKTWNGKQIPENEQFLSKSLREKCIEDTIKNKGTEKNAYFYAILGGPKYGRGQTNCICEKVNIDLEVFPEVAMLFELKSVTEIACADPNSSYCPLTVISLLQDRTASQDDLSSAFDSLKEWVLR